jgi:mannose-6-phosphate isomerase
MHNRVQAYAWGSYTALARLRGEQSTPSKPEAEIWMGAHPLAPSTLLTADGQRSLVELLAERAEPLLGAAVAREFGGLPFMVKLLAAREPLSLQAHPSEAQARAGYEREQAAGVPLDARGRCYKDPHHKPELIVALDRFSALVGFRPAEATARLFEGLGVPELVELAGVLRSAPPAVALRQVFDRVTSDAHSVRHALAHQTLAAARARRDAVPEFAAELAWAARIGDLHPGDAGIVLALALNLLVLEPADAVYLPAGNLHAYLEGTGVEVMASSDNVLRGGLTPKHVDAAELARVLDFRAAAAEVVPTVRRESELHYLCDAREFALSRFDLENQRVAVGPVSGPEIIVVTAGKLEITRPGEGVEVSSGASAFIAAEGGEYVLSGTGRAFRTRVNDGRHAVKAPRKIPDAK